MCTFFYSLRYNQLRQGSKLVLYEQQGWNILTFRRTTFTVTCARYLLLEKCVNLCIILCLYNLIAAINLLVMCIAMCNYYMSILQQ